MTVSILPKTPSLTDDIYLPALKQAVKSADLSVMFQTPDLTYLWAVNIPAVLKANWRCYCHDCDIMDADKAKTIIDLKNTVLETGVKQSIEIAFDEKGRQQWFRLSISTYSDKHGKIIGLISTYTDISELKRREQILRILLREISHRSKNLLAIIQSIASQTVRYSENGKSFMYKFQKRLYSLSRSQDLITDSNWHGSRFQTLVAHQIEQFISANDPRLTLIGFDPYLFPNATLYIGLALHELLINSVAYGALGPGNGHITLSCECETDDDGTQCLHIVWNENFNMIEMEDNFAASFGSSILERVVPTSVSGTAVYKILPNHVSYRLIVPQSQFDLAD